MPIYLGNKKIKLYKGNQKVKKVYLGNRLVYSAGNIVTYYVDSGVTYQEEVDEGESCLSPKTFTPAKSGWEFVGWRTDSTASGSILSSKVMGDDPVTLYAVFRQAVTVTYYNNSTTASSTSGYRYYNNGNTVNPSFALTQAGSSGWTARGWSTSNSGNAGIAYANGASFTRDSNVTLYGMYQQTITVTYYNGSTTVSTTSGTRYYNSGSGNATNPTFSLTPAALSGWTFRGWATSSAAAAGITYSSISGTAFASSTTVYAAYSQTITLSYNGNGNTGGATAAQTGTRYWNTGNVSNPSFTLNANGFSKTSYAFGMWALNGASGTQYSAGASITLSANTTMYAVWTYVGAPFYIVQNWSCIQTLGWTLRKDLGWDNILDYTFKNTCTAGKAYPSVSCNKEDDDENAYFYAVSSPINTNGNHTLAIEFKVSDNAGCEITVNGVKKSVGDREMATFDITGKLSVTITARVFAWAYNQGPYMQFTTLRLY